MRRFVLLYAVILCFISHKSTIFALSKDDMEKFRIREYGRMELAGLYCSTILPESAWKKFRKWMAIYPGLMDRLAAMGYSDHCRSFTPAQVQAIVDALGEP
jgi:hypothetical protein